MLYNGVRIYMCTDTIQHSFICSCLFSAIFASRFFTQDFPEHRLKFFRLLKAVNTYCFGTLFEIPPEHQKLVVDSVVWAFKHTERNIGGYFSFFLFIVVFAFQLKSYIRGFTLSRHL